MKIIAPAFSIGVLSLCLAYMVLVSDEAGELPPMTEIKLYISGEFQSEVCRSPDLSPLAPYWEFNGTPLNDDEINAYYGAIVSRDVSGEGHHLSTLSIQAVNLSLNATVISCLVNRTVVLQYHVTVVEAKLVYISTEELHSALCVSPSLTSPAPYFKYKDIILNDVEVNEFYRANVIRSLSIDGRYQAMVVIAALGSTLDDSSVTCLVNSTVIWKVHMIINGSRDDPSTTTAAMETTATNDGITQLQTTSMLQLSKSAGLSEMSIRIITSTFVLLVVLGAVIITVTIISAFIWKYWKANRAVDGSNTGKPPDQDNADRQQPIPTSSQPPTTPAVPQVPDSKSAQESIVVTQPMVTGVSWSGRTPRHERVSSMLRHSDGNITLSCSVIDPDEDLSAVNTTTSTYVHSLNNSFEIGGNESNYDSEMLAAATIPTSREEQSREGQSLTIGINCKNENDLLKGRTGSSLQCQYIAGDTCGERNNSGTLQNCTAV